MSHVLSKAPVYFAAAQVRHNPVAAIDSDPVLRARIQEALRSLGYSDQREIKQSVHLATGGANVELQQPSHLLCLNSAKTSAIVVQTDRYWLQTTHYLDFDAFKDAFLIGLRALHGVVKFDYVDAVSMRMLDAIVPKENETLQQYLPQELLGLDDWAEKRSWRLLHQGAEHVFQTDKHRVVFRCVRRPGEMDAPLDSGPVGMEFLDRHKEIHGPHAVLDTDASLERRQEIDVDLVGEQLVSIKKDLSQCFAGVVHPYALEQWK